MTKKNVLAPVTSFLVTLFVSATAFAQDAAANEFDMKKWGLLAAAIAICGATIGGAIAQGKTASTALDGLARNPGASGKIFVPMILGLALIESLVIYALLIAFQILGKVQ